MLSGLWSSVIDNRIQFRAGTGVAHFSRDVCLCNYSIFTFLSQYFISVLYMLQHVIKIVLVNDMHYIVYAPPWWFSHLYRVNRPRVCVCACTRSLRRPEAASYRCGAVTHTMWHVCHVGAWRHPCAETWQPELWDEDIVGRHVNARRDFHIRLWMGEYTIGGGHVFIVDLLGMTPKAKPKCVLGWRHLNISTI